MDKCKRTYQALSIVEPFGRFIAEGQKKMEIRSWQPESLPLKDLVIVENKNYLTQDDDEEIGRADVICDVVAFPVSTPLIQAAQQRGIPTINGGEIVALQAAQQFELYTGVRPSDELIEAAERYSQQG